MFDFESVDGCLYSVDATEDSDQFGTFPTLKDALHKGLQPFECFYQNTYYKFWRDKVDWNDHL